MKKSGVYKFEGKLFRYNFDWCEVEYIAKATKEELKDNEEWQKKYGKNLWDIDKDGYIVIETVGLRTENWKNKAVRDEYLAEYISDLNYAAAVELAYERELAYDRQFQ